jgi:hypothetical protein
VKPPARVTDWPVASAMRTSRAPAAPAGVTAVMRVLLTTTTLVAAAPPTVTVAPAAKFVPVSVTAVPPAVGPETGAIALSVGAAAPV